VKRFLPPVLLAALIILTAPFVGGLRDLLFDVFPGSALRILAVSLAAVGVGALIFALFRIRRHRLLRYAGLGVVGLLLWLQTVGFAHDMAQVVLVERIHVVEYGLLAYLLYRAFLRSRHGSGKADDLGTLLLPLLWAVVAGTLDEAVQWWVETRTGEVRDVVLNALAALCGLFFGLSVEPPERFSWRLPRRRWRTVGDGAAVAVLVLGGFVYHAHLGYLIDDPEVGRFRSWFTREELREGAARRAERWAEDPPGEASPWRKEDPYLVEAGSRTMHRNLSFQNGLFYQARHANDVLEKYYAPYLDLESFRQTGDRRFPERALRRLARETPGYRGSSYDSPVLAGRIFVRPSKPVFLALLLPAVALLWGLPRLAGRRAARRTATAAPLFFLLAVALAVPADAQLASSGQESAELPWRRAGLTDRQAAAHLLHRFAYGPRPGEIERVVELGIDNWIEWQLAGDAPGPLLEAKLARLSAVGLAPREISRTYPHHAQVVAEAIAGGLFTREEYAGEAGEERRRRAEAALDAYAEERGYRPRGEVLAQLRAQKLYRARYSESQLVEVLTDFWFNHFNVSAEHSEAKQYVLSYERDAIRPRVLGRFRDLLGATARHPAMLLYLGNAHSVAEPSAVTTFDRAMTELDEFSPTGDPNLQQWLARELRWRPPEARRLDPVHAGKGLNENYARELLELHTLGVDGGYSQGDVIEVARALTGWTLLSKRNSPPRRRRLFQLAAERTDLGFVIDGQFLFRPDHHDSEAKTILGTPFPAGGGVEEGEAVLDLVAAHPATARHLARKLAVRFVSDQPSEELVAELARTYLATGGDLREVVRTLLEAPELWRAAPSAGGRSPGKLKTPFELVASALRVLGAELDDTAATARWIARAGQPLYAYAAPTGYPDREAAWASVGSLLGRLNFTFELARGKVDGVRHDPLDLLEQLEAPREPASITEAVEIYLPLLLPERHLGPLLTEFAERAEALDAAEAELEEGEAAPGDPDDRTELRRRRRAKKFAILATAVLLASPELQRR